MSPVRIEAAVLLAVYTAVMIALARVGQRRTRTFSDFAVGGRSLGGVVLGLSFFATYASTNSYLGFSSKAYAYGPGWLLLVPAAVGLSWLAWAFVAPRLRDVTEELGSLTLPDYIGFRFQSRRARLVAAVIVVFASLLYMTAVYKGIGTLLATFLGLGYVAAIALVLVIVVLYTSAGGFHSVVRTDAVQAVVMVIAAALLFAGIWRAAGGLGSLEAMLEQPQRFAGSAPKPPLVLFGIVLASTIKFVVEPRQLSRFYALESRRAARTGIWVSSLAFLVVFSLLTPIGLLAHRLGVVVADTDRIVPELIAGGAIFSAPVAAFLLLAMVSAAMSSLDSVLLVVATTWQRDVVDLLRGQDDRAHDLMATRVSVVAFALLTGVLAARPPGGIVELTSFSGAIYGACFLPAVVLGLTWRRGDGRAVISSFVVGAGVLVLWRLSPFSASLHEVFPAIVSSLLVYAGVAWRTGPARSVGARAAPPAEIEL